MSEMEVSSTKMTGDTSIAPFNLFENAGMMGRYPSDIQTRMHPTPDPMFGMGTPSTLAMQQTLNASNMGNSPYIEILEQPRARGLRFRYKCEGRSAGTIPGESSTQEHRTFPTIKIANYTGPSAIVVVSCVTKDERPRPHPHSLVGKDCKQGVCTVKLKGSTTVSFPSLGIQCATKKEIQDSLKLREKIRVDPWGTGYHQNVNSIELSTVRLAFQAFLPDDNGKYTRIVAPTASQCIFDKKAVTDLVICRLSKQSGSAKGGDEVFILCEKVTKDDIQVRFFEETKEEGLKWEKYGVFGQQDVHRQVAIVFKTPEYRDQNMTHPVTVMIQLRRPSDDEVSDPKPFQYIPNDSDPDFITRKRKRKNMNFDKFFKDSKLAMPTHPADPLSAKDTIKERLIKKANRNNQTMNRSPVTAGSQQYSTMPQYSIDNTGASAMMSPEHHQYGATTTTAGATMVRMQEDDQQMYYMEDVKQEVTSPHQQQQTVIIHDGNSYTEMTAANGQQQAYSQMAVMGTSQADLMANPAISQHQVLSSVTMNNDGSVVVENNGGQGIMGGSGAAGGGIESGGSIFSMLKDTFKNADGISSLPSMPSAVIDNFHTIPDVANNMAFLHGDNTMVAAEETVQSINEDVSN